MILQAFNRQQSHSFPSAFRLVLGLGILTLPHLAFAEADSVRAQKRVDTVCQTPGLVAFWDFVQREDGPQGKGRFVAHTNATHQFGYPLEPHNISQEFWKDGEPSSLEDFPLLGRGPFGQAIQFSDPKSLNALPVLEVPRSALHNTPLDIKGPGASASMVVWMVYHQGNHAIAGIWHEGTDTKPNGIPPVVQEKGRRQFALFAGLAANPGGVSAHISENGLASFGDRYARHLATAPGKMPKISPSATAQEMDPSWTAVGFTYDNSKRTLTTYLDGTATEYWVEDPAHNPFYAPAERAWKQAQYAKYKELQGNADPSFPADQLYTPPEEHPLQEEVLLDSAEQRVVLRTYEFTKVRATFKKNADGQLSDLSAIELVGLKANPYWFGKDIYQPDSIENGGPFTIGRVIHSNRHSTLAAQIGGVAVFNEALSPKKMSELAGLCHGDKTEPDASPILKFQDVVPLQP